MKTFDIYAPTWLHVSEGDREQVLRYLDDQTSIASWKHVGLCDVILVLLKMNTESSLASASALLGRPIKKCPAAVPPWPPKAVAAPKVPRVEWVGKNPCPPASDAHRRFAIVKRGMTEDQLFARRITRRDITHWKKGGHLRMTQ